MYMVIHTWPVTVDLQLATGNTVFTTPITPGDLREVVTVFKKCRRRGPPRSRDMLPTRNSIARPARGHGIV